MSRGQDLSGRVLERTVHRWKEEGTRIVLRKRRAGPLVTALFRLFRIEPYADIRLDPLGSEVWLLLDGHRTVAHVLEALQERHPDEEHLAERLGRFLSMLAMNRLVRMQR